MKKADSSRLQIQRRRIDLYEMPDGATRSIPYAVYSRGEGPRLWITSTVHGNEVTGIRTLQKLAAFLKSKPFTGTVSCAPVLNPSGCERNTREVSETNEDLNRSFPSRNDGSFTERIANAIFREISDARPDCHVDLHADSSASIAYVILDRYMNVDAAMLKQKIEGYTAAFDALRLYDWPPEQYRVNRLDSSLSGSLLNQSSIPSFVVELGTLRYPDESMAELACQGLIALMGRLGMLAAEHVAADTPPVTLRRATPLRAEKAGLVRYLVTAGQRVEAGTPVCEMSDVFGDSVEVLRSPCAGIVIAMPDRYWCSPGMGLLTMAVADE